MALPEDLPLTRQELAKLFKAAGYTTYSQLGKALGVTKTTVCKWLKGNLNLSEKAKEAIRNIPVLPGAEPAWNDYLAEVPATIAHYKATLPPPEIDEVPAMDSKALAEAIAKELAPVLKVDVGEWAELLAKRLDTNGLAPTIADQLFPDLRKVVEELAQKFAATVVGQEDAVEKALDACVERVALLLKQNTNEVTDAVATRTEGLVATLKNRLDAVIGMLRGLQAKADSQAAQDALEQAQDRAKADDLGDTVQQLQTRADELGSRAQRIETRSNEVGSSVQQLHAKADAHLGQLERWLLALGGLIVLVGVALGALIIVRTSGLVPGDRLTRGGGVGEGAVRGVSSWHWADRLAPGVGGEGGERKAGRPMPHSPLPGQAVAPCQGSEKTRYGSCWVGPMEAPAPCPPDQFEEGGKCYIPVRADPNVPVGTEPKRSGQETPTQDRPNVGMPRKEQD